MVYSGDFSRSYSRSQYGNPYLFTGRRYDPETAKYQYRHRDYSFDQGRFFQPDPVGYVDGMNMYEYVEDTPVGNRDPIGLFIIEPMGIPQWFQHTPGCFSGAFMSIVLFLERDEELLIKKNSSKGVFIQRKHAVWTIKDCDGNPLPEESGKETTTFINKYVIGRATQASPYVHILEPLEDAADVYFEPDGGFKTGYYEVKMHSERFVPQYSGILAKKIKTQCTQGNIKIISQFLLYTKASLPGAKEHYKHLWDDTVISGPEYLHGMQVVNGWYKTGQKYLIANGTIKVNIQWNCNCKPSIVVTVFKDAQYIVPKGGINCRIGREWDARKRKNWIPFLKAR